MSSQQDTLDDDDIEILEVIGLDEDGFEGAGDDNAGAEEEPEEITLSFEEEKEPVPSPPDPSPRRGPVGAEGEEGLRDQERLLRLRADFENYKKRVEREREADARIASAGLVTRLLPVLDNFERALSSELSEGDGEAFREGVALIFRQLLEELRKEGLTAVDSLEQPFDPNVHEAVATDRESGLAPSVIVEELQRGYLLHDRLLRPALVKVAVSDSEPSDDGSGHEDG